MNKKNRNILITGASNGIGLTTANFLADEDYNVYAGVRNICDAGKLSKKCEKIKLDVTSSNDISNFVNSLPSNDFDAVIHNAGIAIIGAIDEATPEEIESIFKVNVFGVINLTQSLLPLMRKNKRGHIIILGSMLGIESSPFLGLYSATKHALEAIAASWAVTLHKWNINVSIIEPGSVKTNLPNSLKKGSYFLDQENPYGKFSENAKRFIKKILLEGIEPIEVAKIISKILLCPSPNFRYQTCSFSESVLRKNLRSPQAKDWILENKSLFTSLSEN